MSKTVNILSIDGGGIRGILPATFLAVLEERLQQATNKPDARLSDYFDFITGTSTGGLLACVYLTPDETDATRPRFTAKQAAEFYFAYGGTSFAIQENTGFHKYSPEGLEAQLRLYFKELKLSQLIKPCCITAYDLIHTEPYLFLSHKAIGDPRSDFFVRSVIRSTTALPGVFPPSKTHCMAERPYTFIDGSIFAYNPAFFAYLQARTLFPHAESIFLLSLGTGLATTAYTDAQTDDSTEKNWARMLANIAFDAHSDMVNFQLEHIFKSKPDYNYIRLQPSLHGLNKEMDNVTTENIASLYKAGEGFVKSNERTLSEIVELLTRQG
ncbi:MAG: patatin-like phospholipase family protein [Bacteroidia bacterium]